jgi:hypothetical protein
MRLLLETHGFRRGLLVTLIFMSVSATSSLHHGAPDFSMTLITGRPPIHVPFYESLGVIYGVALPSLVCPSMATWERVARRWELRVFCGWLFCVCAFVPAGLSAAFMQGNSAGDATRTFINVSTASIISSLVAAGISRGVSSVVGVGVYFVTLASKEWCPAWLSMLARHWHGDFGLTEAWAAVLWMLGLTVWMRTAGQSSWAARLQRHAEGE